MPLIMYNILSGPTEELFYEDFISNIEKSMSLEEGVAFSVQHQLCDNRDTVIFINPLCEIVSDKFDSDYNVYELRVEIAKFYQDSHYAPPRISYTREEFRINQSLTVNEALRTVFSDYLGIFDDDSLRQAQSKYRIDAYTPDELQQTLLIRPFGVYHDKRGGSDKFYFIDKRDRTATTIAHTFRVHTVDRKRHEVVMAVYECQLIS